MFQKEEREKWKINALQKMTAVLYVLTVAEKFSHSAILQETTVPIVCILSTLILCPVTEPITVKVN